MELIEFAPGSEVITAAFNSPVESGEAFGTPISVGYYIGTHEIHIQHNGATLNIQAVDVNEFCKQLKRAAKLALEQPLS